MSKQTKDYDTGYRKPPEHTRFQKGHSGNPKGRPKGAKNLVTVLNRALREKVTVIEHGRRKTITKLEAAIKALVNRSVKGDTRATQQLLGLGPVIGLDTDLGSTALDSTDAGVLAGVMQRFGIKRNDTDEGDKS